MAAAAPGRSPFPWTWVALAIALSPALVELARHLAAEPADRYVAVAAVLLWLARGVPGQAARRPRLGLAALGAALVLELLGVASGSWSFARIAMPVAFLGMAWLGTGPSPRVAPLAFGLVPAPNFLANLGTPWIESATARVAEAALEGWSSLEAAGPLLHAGQARLELTPHDDGLRVALVLAQLGWFAGLRAGAAWPALLTRACLASFGTLAIQPLALALAVGLLLAGWPGAASAWLVTGVWLAVAVAGLALTGTSGARSRSPAAPR